MDSTVGEHNTKLCVIQTGMTITHGGFENKSLPFPPLLKLEKKKNHIKNTKPIVLKCPTQVEYYS